MRASSSLMRMGCAPGKIGDRAPTTAWHARAHLVQHRVHADLGAPGQIGDIGQRGDGNYLHRRARGVRLLMRHVRALLAS
jgi:hypothetical protein